ncbi:MAG: recombinase family protein [Thermoflexales bacterium]|nr:recombinase family protein [Thermoflexales bacterium]
MSQSYDLDPRDMPPGTKAWVYLRHSPGDNQTIESQEAEVMRLVREKGWVVDRVFRDQWVSGKSTDNREAFNHMIYLAKQKPRLADLLIIWDFSRFARNQIHSQLYKAQLRADGWQILSMKDELPLGPFAIIFEAMTDWRNEQFLEDLRENTKRGLRFIAERGCVPVGAICKGYTFREEQIATYHDGTSRMGRKPELDPEVGLLVIKAFEMKARGAPHSAISKETGLYGPKAGSWDHLFRNRAYIGEYEFLEDVFTNIYPPLVSRELFEAVQKRMPERKARKLAGRHHPRRKGSRFFLANIAECMYCGSPMEGKSTQGHRYYACSQHNTNVESCPESGLIPADPIEEEIIRILVTHVLVDDYLHDLLEWTNEHLNAGLEELTLRVNHTRSDLSEADRLAMKMARNFGTMESPTRIVERALREQCDLADQLRLELIVLEQELANSRIEVTQEQITAYVSRARAMVDHGEFFDLREVSEQLCSRIVMGGEECRVELHFPAM